ncbi:DUF192 domain-containing protein [Halosimplex aquaticum]|uniref:DUF192 domain-containing protein n=1 Tax=Halosimplex aquaticum TaxID=3026162 RepID=A0ABD5Y552_9EURY|nr:DUF192 domain-containing protein [Halosimplex aquaticum]
MRRRAFLAACAVTGVGGCLGNGTESDSTAGPGAATTTEPSGRATTQTATATETPTERETSTATPSPTATPEPTPSTETGTPLFPGYETTDVRVTTPEGEELGSVSAAIADTQSLRYTGLSDTESLPEDRGMLFVYDEVGDHTYVMREMDFGLDIVYADDEGTITRIHHAPAPGPNEDGEDQTYPGRGQYVLEVNKGWTTERGVEEGDVLQFEL